MWNGNGVMDLRPSDIRFSHDSIACRFSDGVKIGHVLDDLAEGRTFVEDIPPIKVVKVDGIWFSSDNRRLWVFHQLEYQGLCDSIPVVKTSLSKLHFTTDNDGTSVEVRGDPGGQWYQASSESDSSDEDGEEETETESDRPGSWEESDSSEDEDGYNWNNGWGGFEDFGSYGHRDESGYEESNSYDDWFNPLGGYYDDDWFNPLGGYHDEEDESDSGY